MKPPITFALLAAGVAVVSFVGLQLALSPDRGSTPSAPPASLATTPPQSSDGFPTIPPPATEVAIDASFGLPMSVVLPDDWAPLIENSGQADFARTGGAYPYIGFFLVSGVYRDPCRPEAGLYLGGNGIGPIGHSHEPTPEPRIPGGRIATGLRGFQGAFESSPSIPVTVGGLAAERFAISNQVNPQTSGCSDGGLLPLFVTISGDDVATSGGTTQEIWVVPTRGLLIVGEVGSSPADRLLIEAIVASVRLSTASSTSSPDPLASGTVHVDDTIFGRRVEITVPSDWAPQVVARGQWAFARNGSAYPFVGLYVVEDVFRDPCRPEAGTWLPNQLAPLDATQLEHALTRLDNFAAGEVTSIEVGGRPARHFQLSNQIDTSAAGCADGAVLPLFEVGGERVSTNGGTSQQIWIVQATPAMLIVGELPADPTSADEALLAAIIDSIAG